MADFIFGHTAEQQQRRLLGIPPSLSAELGCHLLAWAAASPLLIFQISLSTGSLASQP